MASYIQKTFRRGKTSDAIPPPSFNPLPVYFWELCPQFDWESTEREACGVGIPALVQATFYVMMRSLHAHVDILPAVLSEALEEWLEGLKFCSFELWLESNREVLL